MMHYDGEEEAIDEEIIEEEEDHPLDHEENVNRVANSDEDEENIIPVVNLNSARKKSLKHAFLAANLKHAQCNILLNTLRSFPFNLNFILKDAKTILQTPTVVASNFIQETAGGEYLHVGFRTTLEKKLKRIPLNLIPAGILIDFITDGAKLNKDSLSIFTFL